MGIPAGRHVVRIPHDSSRLNTAMLLVGRQSEQSSDLLGPRAPRRQRAAGAHSFESSSAIIFALRAHCGRTPAVPANHLNGFKVGPHQDFSLTLLLPCCDVTIRLRFAWLTDCKRWRPWIQ